MELPIFDVGEIVRYKGVRFVVTESVQGCRGCYFRRVNVCPVQDVGVCSPPWRKDAVIFRKVDKNKVLNHHTKSHDGSRRRKNLK